MKFLISLIPALIALYLVIETGNAIRCFKCNSFHQQDCADWFDNRTHNLEDCGNNITMCRKIIQEVEYNGETNLRYIRQCAKHGEVGGDEGRRCTDRTGTYRIKMRYCHCDNQAGCNGASTTKMPLILSVLPLMGLIVSKMYL